MNNRYNCVTLMVINLTNFSCLCVYKQSMPYVSWHSSFLQWYLQGSSPREWSDEFSGRTFVIKPKTASVLKDTGYKYRSNRLKPVLNMHTLWSNYEYISSWQNISRFTMYVNAAFVKFVTNLIICTWKLCFVICK